MATADRGLLRAPNTSSPRLSMKREMTPPSVVSDPALLHIHDRLNQLDSKVLELRTTVLTKDAYIDRRHKEDESIRREFDNQRTLSSRIDSVVGKSRTDISQLKTDLSHLKSEIIQLKTHVDQLGAKEDFIRDDVNRLQTDVNQLQLDVQRVHTDVCSTRTDLSQIQSIVSQLRMDLMTLQRDTSQHFGQVFSRFSAMESHMKHMEKIRFNSLVHTVHAPITPVPAIADDGSLRMPDYFPRTVWKFWCLKKRNRLHRLVELAEFYELEGYQYWGRMPHPHDSMFIGDGYMSDSSDSSELPSDLTRSEATRQFPEQCHQALAARLGLVYYKIRNEVGEGPHAHVMAPAPKRRQEEVVSINSSTRMRPSKASRRSNAGEPTTSIPHKIITANYLTGANSAIDTKSIISEGLDRLGWNVNASQISDDTMSKISGLVKEEVNSLLLQAVEHGRVKLQPSRMEVGRTSPTDSSKLSLRSRRNPEEAAIAEATAAGTKEDDAQSEVNTVPTEIISPISRQAELDGDWVKDQQLSETSSP